MGVQGTWYYARVAGVATQTGYEEVSVPMPTDTPQQILMNSLYPPSQHTVPRGAQPGEVAFNHPPSQTELAATVFPVVAA